MYIGESIVKSSGYEFLFDAQFNYCLVIWMLHSRQNNKKNKHLHER